MTELKSIEQFKQAISHSESLLLKHTPSEINNFLPEVSDELLNEDKQLRFRYTKLRAFAFLSAAEYIKAEEQILLAYETVPADLDLFYVMASVNNRLKEHRLVIDYCQQYIELYDSDNDNSCDYTDSSYYLSQIFDFIGQAYLGLVDFDSAEKYLKLSIDADPSNYKSYVDLARFYSSNQKYQDALEVLQHGTSYCSDNMELKMLKKSIEKPEKESEKEVSELKA